MHIHGVTVAIQGVFSSSSKRFWKRFSGNAKRILKNYGRDVKRSGPMDQAVSVYIHRKPSIFCTQLCTLLFSLWSIVQWHMVLLQEVLNVFQLLINRTLWILLLQNHKYWRSSVSFSFWFLLCNGTRFVHGLLPHQQYLRSLLSPPLLLTVLLLSSGNQYLCHLAPGKSFRYLPKVSQCNSKLLLHFN